jgi:hypothetical protein
MKERTERRQLRMPRDDSKGRKTRDESSRISASILSVPLPLSLLLRRRGRRERKKEESTDRLGRG